MNQKRAISELEQIYGFLSPDKQMAIDEAIKALETVERIVERRAELGRMATGNISLSEATEYYALVRLLEVQNDE